MTDLIEPENLISNPIMVSDYKAGKTVIVERRLLKKDANEITVEISGKMLEDGRYQSFVRDITERKRIEHELQKSELQYKLLVEQAPDGIFITSAEHLIQDVNASGCKMLGYELSEFQKMKFKDLISPENLKKISLNYSGLESGNTVMSERILVRKDGTEIPVEISAKLLSDGRFQSFIRNITERKKAEEEIIESELRYRSLIEQASDTIMITDLKGNFSDVNSSMCKLFGYTREELLSQNISTLIESEQLKNDPIRFDLLQQGQSFLRERKMITKDGNIIDVEANVKMLPDGRVLAIARDIRDRKKIKDELKEKNVQLRNLTAHIQNAIEDERKHIAREIHDELGQLLTGLKIDISWINKRQGLSEELINKTEEMLQLTDRTIQSIRKIATELRPGILDDLGLFEAIIWQSSEFEIKTGIECKVKGEILRTNYSPQQNITAFRILQESLTNVMRHANANRVQIKLEEKNDFLTIEIMDDGIGIETENRAEQKSLGLLGMKERASIIGGTLSINSQLLQGTTVTVKIPFLPESKHAT